MINFADKYATVFTCPSVLVDSVFESAFGMLTIRVENFREIL